jgi:hypothetical protein
MNRREERHLQEVEEVARDFWRMVKTGLHNQTGGDNPYVKAVCEEMERRYWWLKRGGETPAAPSLDKLSGSDPDFTGGEESVAYLHRLRGGETPAEGER